MLLLPNLVAKANAKSQTQWCQQRKSCGCGQYETCIVSVEPTFTVFSHKQESYVQSEARGGAVMVRAAISRHSAEPLILLNGRVTGQKQESFWMMCIQ